MRLTHAAGWILAVQNELAEIGTELKLLTATDTETVDWVRWFCK
jgi:hypothetical protein